MPMSTYLANRQLNHFLGISSQSMPLATFLALYTVAPTAAGGGTEVSGGGYARLAVNFGAAASAQSRNTNTLTFNASASWGSVSHWAIHDHASAGNMLWYGALGSPRTIVSGDQIIWDINSLSISGIVNL